MGLSGSRLSVGKLSGRRGLQGKLHELGFELEGDALDAVYRAAIALADAKKEVTDADLVALVEQQAAESPQARPVARRVTLDGWSVTSSAGGRSSGQRVAGASAARSAHAEGTGNGPVDALFGAVDAAVAAGPRLAPRC